MFPRPPASSPASPAFLPPSFPGARADKVGDEALGPEAGGIWLGARLEDCRPAAGGADAAAALLRAAAVPASETARVIGSAGPGKKPICVDVAGPATVEDFIRRLLNDASDGSSSAAAFAAPRAALTSRASLGS